MTKKKAPTKPKKKSAKKPNPQKKSARTIRTAKKRKEFLEILSATCNVSQACRISGFPRQSAYDQREIDAKFLKKWDDAIDIGIDALEQEARRRAYMGTRKPVFHKGKECGVIQEYSDTLTIFLLKAHRPEKYRERSQIEHSTEDGKPFTFVMNLGGVS